MKLFKWNPGKNTKLKLERGVSFEMVIDKIEHGSYKVLRNTSKNHPGQRCFPVTLHRKNWLVPFKEYKNHFFLHTIFKVIK